MNPPETHNQTAEENTHLKSIRASSTAPVGTWRRWLWLSVPPPRGARRRLHSVVQVLKGKSGPPGRAT